MAVEDFTAYTETDPNSRITVTANKVAWSALQRQESAWVYADKGAAFFDGDFTHILTVNLAAASSGGFLMAWALTNDIDGFRTIDNANGDGLFLGLGAPTGTDETVGIHELDGGLLYSDSYTLVGAMPHTVYVKLVRDESVGTYGTFYAYIYSDAARTTLLDTLSITLHSSKKDYRYIFPCQAWVDDTTLSTTGYTEDLNISLTTTAPSVTTQAATSVDKTTATGNGNITGLGVPVATQYGSVWATHINPTTDDSKTEDVASPPATGAFTSSLTGLVPNTLYYSRAYVTNSVGTFYGAEVTFTTLVDVPVMTTNNPTEVATVTALGHGSIDNNGGSAITQHGVCWALTSNPTTADSKTEEGATTVIGSFSSSMTGLTAGTLYHVRAYAVNTTGTGYGADVTFTTLVAGAPIVVTRSSINVRTTTATGVGNIIDIGGAAVTQHGHCWGTSINPTTADSKTTLGTGAVGAFASDITVLTDGTTYYVRAYATNSFGTAYGNNDIIYPTSVWGATRGHLTVLGEHLAYTSRTGKKKAVLGFDI
ncbi:hypothetical protein LCGC14_0907360 [marine sediment metagenome]|uniref:Fibronectin type-III domain-containing protein n=1 Tax=marine sediment metagenome TaxID=412755 RepID=A0A0F9S1H8_9ZZZZ